MDLEAESIVSIDTGMSSDIAESCNKLLDIQKKISTAEEEMKKLKEVETTLSEQTIPNLMQQAGISMLKLADGSSVEVKPFYSARIPASKSEQAFNWLRENGLVEELKQKGLAVQQKTSVHPSTLRGFVREQIQDLGKDVPAELFGTYVANKTKITTKEQS
jgi:DNA-binding transcriptional regulator YhcF (GntR family)